MSGKPVLKPVLATLRSGRRPLLLVLSVAPSFSSRGWTRRAPFSSVASCSRFFHSLLLRNAKRRRPKCDKEHMSLCLTGWPSGHGKDSTTGGTHPAGWLLWQISLKMKVRLQYITMLDGSLVAQNDSTHLFHYLLQKMTFPPRVHSWIGLSSNEKDKKIKIHI